MDESLSGVTKCDGSSLFRHMSSLFHISHRSQLIATAIGASVLTASLLAAYNTHNRRTKRKQLDREIQQSLASRDSLRHPPQPKDEDEDTEFLTRDEGIVIDSSGLKERIEYDESLIREQLARNYAFFGDEGMQKIRERNVVVVGCGGVGSWAAVMLVRS